MSEVIKRQIDIAETIDDPLRVGGSSKMGADQIGVLDGLDQERQQRSFKKKGERSQDPAAGEQDPFRKAFERGDPVLMLVSRLVARGVSATQGSSSCLLVRNRRVIRQRENILSICRAAAMTLAALKNLLALAPIAVSRRALRNSPRRSSRRVAE